jgi:hypothetical protein
MTSLSPSPHQHLLPLFFLGLLSFTHVRWWQFIHLICIHLMINDVLHVFIHFMVIYIISLENCLFRSIIYFEINLFGFVQLNYWYSFYILYVIFLSGTYFTNIFSNSLGLPWALISISLASRSFLVWCNPLIFVFVSCLFVQNKSCQLHSVDEFPPMFCFVVVVSNHLGVVF